MISFNALLPALPTDTTIDTALMLLAVAADPAATSTRLTELIDQRNAILAAHAEATAERKAAEDAQAALADVVQREQAVVGREAAVVEEQTRLAVTSSAFTSRAAALDKRESELSKREGEIAAKEKALAARIASYRNALA